MSWLDTALAAYATIQINGVALPAERVLNLVSGFTAVDDAANGRTNVTATGGGGGGGFYQTVEDEGLALTQRATMNFIGDAVIAADNSGSARTDVTIAGGYLIEGLATTNTVLTYAAPFKQIIQPVSLGVGSLTVTFSGTTWPTGAIIMCPDSEVGANSYAGGTRTLTVDGGSYQIEDPYANGGTLAATWVTPTLASGNTCGHKPGWILLPNNAGTRVWRAFMSC